MELQKSLIVIGLFEEKKPLCHSFCNYRNSLDGEGRKDILLILIAFTRVDTFFYIMMIRESQVYNTESPRSSYKNENVN